MRDDFPELADKVRHAHVIVVGGYSPYMDIKLIDPLEHKRYCGLSNGTTLKNFQHLIRAAANGLSFLPRVPLIPGITDAKANLEGIAGFLKENDWKSLNGMEAGKQRPLLF